MKHDPATIDSFWVDDDAAPALPVLDRSTLERYATCPAQARYVEEGIVNTSSALASAGQEVHTALGMVLCEYVREGGTLTKGNLFNRAQDMLLQARPDVQPEALRGFRNAIWPWAQLVSSIAVGNLLAFDGGEGRRSGQLAADFVSAGSSIARLTSEIDLLYAGPSPAVLHEVDYKTGWKFHSVTDIRDSFQFGLHGWLIFANFPAVEIIETRVWNTRSNSLTRPVEFRREDCTIWTEETQWGRQTHVGAIHARIGEALHHWHDWHSVEPQEAPCWPEVDKCAICSAAVRCPLAGADAVDINLDPLAFVAQMVALEASLKAREKVARAYVDEHGDIVNPEAGAGFGIEKPPSSKKPPKTLYQIKSSASEETSGTT